jgi:chromosomal replication initiation ATPase DnaA
LNLSNYVEHARVKEIHLSIDNLFYDNIDKEALDYTSNKPSLDSIINFHAKKNQLKIEDLRSQKRRSDIIKARDEAIAEIYTRRPDVSLTGIGIAFGGRSYATVGRSLERKGIRDQTRCLRPRIEDEPLRTSLPRFPS